MPELQNNNQLLCAYFEPAWREEHMTEIADHNFTKVVLCLTEEDITAGRRSELDEVSRFARENASLDCWADLWGVAGVFGGEASSAFAQEEQPCFHNPALLKLLKQGIKRAKDLGASTLFWDEPHFPDKLSCCQGREPELIACLSEYAGKIGLRNAVCFTSSEENMKRLAALASRPDIHNVGTDPYYQNYPGTNDDMPDHYVGRYAAKVAHIARSKRIDGHIWVQGFGLKNGWEDIPLMAAGAAVRAGINNVGFWGFRACLATPEIAPDNPRKVWREARELKAIVDK